MVESLNRTLEHSLSWRRSHGASTRGAPASRSREIVLLNTLVYRVEQVFLIDRAAGLLLQHVTDGAASPGRRHGLGDADRDSRLRAGLLQGGRRATSLEALQVGELLGLDRAGPAAPLLAVVIRGTAPRALRRRCRRARDASTCSSPTTLEPFDGDAGASTARGRCSRPACSRSIGRRGAGRGPRGAWIGGRAAVALLGLGRLLRYARRAALERLRRRAAGRTRPGRRLARRARAAQFVVTGLRDPLARDPRRLLAATRLAADDVVERRWALYQALDPALVLRPGPAGAAPPAGATLTIARTALVGTGTPRVAGSPRRRLAPVIPGVTPFDVTGIRRASCAEGRPRHRSGDGLFVQGTPRLSAGQDDGARRAGRRLRRLDARPRRRTSLSRRRRRPHRRRRPGRARTCRSAASAPPRSCAAIAARRSPALDLEVVGASAAPSRCRRRHRSRQTAQPARRRSATPAASASGPDHDSEKICMLGGSRSARPAWSRRFVSSIFSDKYLTTVGVKIDKKPVSVDGRDVTLMLWDIYGQDDFQTRAACRTCAARPATSWSSTARGARRSTSPCSCSRPSGTGRAMPFMLFLNKADLGTSGRSTSTW